MEAVIADTRERTDLGQLIHPSGTTFHTRAGARCVGDGAVSFPFPPFPPPPPPSHTRLAQLQP